MSDISANFRKVLRGYDRTQVDHHMVELAQAAASTWQEAAERTRELNELKAAHGQLRREAESCAQQVRDLEEAQIEAEEPTYAGLGGRIASILTQVDNEAYELRARAQADAANSRALAEEHALATRQDADKYVRETVSAAEDEAARILEEAGQNADTLVGAARQQAERLLQEARDHAEGLRDEAERQATARQDADRLAMSRREEAETAYEQARARSAAAAVDFETTLAARRDSSALEFAAQVQAAEQQLASVRLRSEQTRRDIDRDQQEAASKIAQQLEQATARAQALVAEAKSKAERIRDDSERELAAAGQRRDTINAQLITVRRDLAALAGGKRFDPIRPAEPAADQNESPPRERVAAEDNEVAADTGADAHDSHGGWSTG